MIIMDLTQFKHIKKIHIRYDDLDTFNHVNNKSYLAFLEDARIEIHKKIFKWSGSVNISALVARIEIDYMKPVTYGDELSVYTRLSEIGTKSFELTSLFVVNNALNSDNQIYAKAKVVLVNIDPKTGKSAPISEKDRQAMIEFDK
jgi:acyl-CoA thioester hydrolase